MRIWILLAFNFGWAGTFPVDTSISIPHKIYPAEIKVRIARLDTNLLFYITAGTLSCPGEAFGDIENVKKVPTAVNPNPNQEFSLWTFHATCNGQPNSFTSLHSYYEYEYKYRGRTLYLNFTKFLGPSSFQSGTFPDISFNILIDTTSHINSTAVSNKIKSGFVKPKKEWQKNLLGRKIFKQKV